jgi:MoaA/NifB/PqqE/SkfB family radical SAM enzyme
MIEKAKQQNLVRDAGLGVQKPKTCLLTVTNRCVLQCKMCHLWSLDTSEDEISIDECKNLVDSLRQFDDSPFEIHLIGGEPLIKDGILELVRYISRQGGRSVMTSSGFVIDETMAAAINDSGLSMLNLSLESLNPSVHDFLRGRQGCFNRVMDAIGYLSKFDRRGMKLGINSIISAKNLDDIVELTEWAQKDKRIDSIYFMAVMRPFGSNLGWDWHQNKDYEFLWPKDLARVNAVLDKLDYFKKAGYKIENSSTQFKIFKKYFADPMKFVKTQRCNLADRAINVNAIGDMYICFFMDKLGNIKSDDIRDTWFSEGAWRIRKKMTACKNNCELVINCYYEEE